MMEVKQLVPKLRFKEFDREWKKKKIREVLTIGSGKDYKHLESGDIPVYGTGGLMAKVNTAIHSGKTVFIGRKGSIDKPFYYEGDFWTVDTLFYTHSFKGMDPYFVYGLFQKINWYKHNEASGVPSLSKTTIGSLIVNLPSLPEQQKIASFLSAVDEKIQQLTKKKELLEHYKKGVMQQLFSGKLRFKDDTSTGLNAGNGKDYPEWEDRILDDVIHFSNGKGHEQSIDPEGDFVVVNSKFVSTEGKIRKYCNTQISPLNKGDIVMVMSDVPNGKALAKCYLIEKDNMYTLNQRICGLKAKNNVNEFLIYLIHRNRYYLSFDSGVGQTNLKKDEVLNCPLFIPSSIEEQQKIATYLSNIDNKIESVNQQITQTQTFKKGLLQQLFV